MLQIATSLVTRAIAALDLEELMTWEGDGVRRATIKDIPDSLSDNGHSLRTVRIFAALSTVEHSGDEDNIYSGLKEINGRAAEFSYEGGSYTVVSRCDDYSVKKHGYSVDDDEYEVVARATITMLFTRKTA